MKTMSMILIVVLSALVLPAWGAEERPKSPQQKGRLQHVVCFKFKDTATEAQITELTDAFARLPKQVKEIKAFEWGTNVSPEKHDKGFTHCFIVTFQTEKDRDAYLVHAAHQEFVKLVGPIVDDVFVVDYWARK